MSAPSSTIENVPRRSRLRVWAWRAGILLLLIAAVALGLWGWYQYRPQPEPLRTTLFQGVEYVREVRQSPRALVLHTVTVDLRAPGIGFRVTPGTPGEELPLRARTTSQFAREFGVQVDVNGDGFHPWHTRTPWDYYPHVGDPVRSMGFAASRGVVYAQRQPHRPDATLYLSAEGKPSFTRPFGKVYDAISGGPFLVRNGRISPGLEKLPNGRAPRTAVALDRRGERLTLLVVDGRQPNYSEGVTIVELAELLQELGVGTALALDGGGSTALVAETKPGQWEVLSTPIDNRIPGRERPVANHLGIFARRVEVR